MISSSGAARSDVLQLVKHMGRDMLAATCGDGSVLGIAELQPATKNIMPVKAFLNGLRGDRTVRWTQPPAAAESQQE